MPDEFVNNAIDAFLEDQEGELNMMERTAIDRVKDDHFLSEVVKRMMIWAYEQAMTKDEE